MPRARKMSASSAPPSGSSPSQRRGHRLQVAGHHRALRQADAQAAGRLGRGAVERLAVGRCGHGVADGVEQVGPQRERGRPVLAHGVGPDRVDEGRARRGRRRPRPRSRPPAGGRARPRRRRRTPAGGGRCGPGRRRARSSRLAASRWMRRRRWGGTSSSERVADELVAEPVAGARRLDDQRGEGVVEAGVGLLLGQAGEGDELVGVERRPDHGDALEHLAGGRRDAADHGGVEGLHPPSAPAPPGGPAR